MSELVKPDERIRWLQCNNCGFRLGDGEVAKPICPECGERMNVHSKPKKEQ